MSAILPPSSPGRPVLINKTNVEDVNEFEHVSSAPADRKRPLAVVDDTAARKRAKTRPEVAIDVDTNDDSDSDSDDALILPSRWRQRTAFERLAAVMAAGPSSVSCLPSLSTRPILQSFVSSNKSDVFKLYSMESTSYTSPPYACSYSQSAKQGGKPLLAVTTEEGVVHILDTSKREEWDVEPQRCTFQPHGNGIFDVQWSSSDSVMATASADRSICISSISQTGPTPTTRLQYHSSTVKCVTWDPRRDGDVLCSGSRDGMICVWDLRMGFGGGNPRPALAVSKSHDTGKSNSRRNKMTAPPARGVTSLLLSEHRSHELISSGTFDGILRQWDLRYLETKRRGDKKDAVRAIPSPAAMSNQDPTMYGNTRRARGITSMASGTGATAGLIFALSNDSHIHTYDMASLEPLSGWTADPDSDPWSHSHENMRTNSFYCRLAISSCGRWLASGGARDGSAYLFDVSSSTRARTRPALFGDTRGKGVELNGQKGEVGAVDWAAGNVATCADDGTVRAWRPDLETYRKCKDDSREMAWCWSWANDDQ